jgi:hypothetical protein
VEGRVEIVGERVRKWVEALYNRGMKSNDKTLVVGMIEPIAVHCSSAFLIGTSYKAVNALWSNLSKDLKPTNQSVRTEKKPYLIGLDSILFQRLFAQAPQ